MLHSDNRSANVETKQEPSQLEKVKNLRNLAVARANKPRTTMANEQSFVAFGDQLFEVFCGKQDTSIFVGDSLLYRDTVHACWDKIPANKLNPLQFLINVDDPESFKQDAELLKQNIESQFESNKVPQEIRELIYACWAPLPAHKLNPNYHLYSQCYQNIVGKLDSYIQSQLVLIAASAPKKEEPKVEVTHSENEDPLKKLLTDAANRAKPNDKADEEFAQQIISACRKKNLFDYTSTDQARIKSGLRVYSQEYAKIPEKIKQLLNQCFNEEVDERPTFKEIDEALRETYQELNSDQVKESKDGKAEDAKIEDPLKKLLTDAANRAKTNDKADGEFAQQIISACSKKKFTDYTSTEQARIKSGLRINSQEYAQIPERIKELLIQCFKEDIDEQPTFKDIDEALREAYPEINSNQVKGAKDGDAKDAKKEKAKAEDPITGFLKVVTEKDRFGLRTKAFLESIADKALQSPNEKAGKEIGIQLFNKFCNMPFTSYDENDQKRISKGLRPGMAGEKAIKYLDYNRRTPDKIRELIVECLNDDAKENPTYQRVCEVLYAEREKLVKTLASGKSINEALGIIPYNPTTFTLGMRRTRATKPFEQDKEAVASLKARWGVGGNKEI